MSVRRMVSASAAVAMLLALVATPSAIGATQVNDFTQQVMLGSDLFSTDEDTDFWINSVAPADVDGDGDLDLGVIGFFVVYNESVEDILVIFRNDGPVEGGWGFTEQRVALDGLFAGGSDLAWGDYDGDGDPDLAVGSEGQTVLFRNDAGALTQTTTTPPELPGYEEDSGYTGAYDLRSLTWADADNDGDLDLLVPSVFDRETFDFSTRLLRNDGADGAGGWAFSDASTGLDPTAHAQSAWADDDGDDDLDLFLTNVDPFRDTGFVKRFENTPDGFVGEDLLGIRVEYGLADWGDYDADGLLDVLVAGNIQEEDGTFDTVLRTYHNDGGTYTPTTLIESPNADWLDIHAATWADYDSDGDMDLLVTGNFVGDNEIVGKSEIYANEGGTFVPLGAELPAPVESVGRGGAFTWFDLDNDGDLDYLVAGAYFVPNGNGLVEAQINLFQNGATLQNDRPGTPPGAHAGLGADGIVLDWGAATDDSTPSRALTYDLDVRRIDTGAQAAAIGRVPAPGTLGAVTHWELTGLVPGTYQWSVRAVDSAYNAGPRAGGTLVVPAAEAGLSLAAAPTAPPVQVPPQGGTFRYGVSVRNDSATWKAFEVSVFVRDPGGGLRLVRRLEGSAAAGETFRRTLVQRIGAGAPAGQYVQIVSLRRSPTPETSVRFGWSKLPATGG